MRDTTSHILFYWVDHRGNELMAQSLRQRQARGRDLEEVVVDSGAGLEEGQVVHLRDKKAYHAKHGHATILDLTLLQSMNPCLMRLVRFPQIAETLLLPSAILRGTIFILKES